MTNVQRNQITILRKQNQGYTTIAKVVGLSKDSIRHFCKCHGLAGVRGQVDKPKVILMQTCLNCGSPLEQNTGGRSRKFCCSECRQTWWNKHQYMVVRKAFYTYTCPACGIAFTAYGNSHRKYCSHSCYIAARFRGVAAL